MLNNEFTLSKKSQNFLENLRVYLFSSGKNPKEIEEMIEELEVHLYEAEKKGKPIEKIVGKSPKEYMQMISNEMSIDMRTWFKYICLIVLGSFSFNIIPDLLKGTLSYSVLEIVGHIVIAVIFIAFVLIGFKAISTLERSPIKKGLIFMGISIVPIGLFLGLIFLNEAIATPVIDFGTLGSIITGTILLVFLIGTSLWAKTWVMVIVLALITLPDYLLEQTSLQDEARLITGTLITFGGIAIYLLISAKLEKNKEV
ncbi:MAG: hypothetical protein AB2374_01835 [Cytobacillus gottheilii]